jgi:hypothetical protein
MRVAEEAALVGHRKSIPQDLMNDPTLQTSLKKFIEPLSTNIDRARNYSPGKQPKISDIISPKPVKKGNVVFSSRRRTIPFSPGHNRKSSKNLTSVENTMNTTFMTTTSMGESERDLKRALHNKGKKAKLSAEEVRFNLLSPMQQKFNLLQDKCTDLLDKMPC